MASSVQMPARLIKSLLLPLLAICLSSCKKQTTAENQPSQTVVLMTAHGERPYDLAQSQLLARLILSRDGLKLKTLDAAGDSQLQSRQLDEALADKPVALIVSALEPETLAPRLSTAVQTGMTVIGLGENAANLPCTTFLQVPQKELGKLAGELAVRALTLKAGSEGKAEVSGRVVELRGDETSPAAKARHEGFTEALQKSPGIVIVHDAPGGWSQKGGRERTLEAVRLQSRFDIIYAHNDDMALGAAAALGDQRSEVLVIGSDGFFGSSGGLNLVNFGDIDATIHQPLLTDLAWQIVVRRLEDATFTPKPTYRVSSSLITPKNVNEFLQKGPPALPKL
jgi:ribose transport system substrate-binding protein